MKLLLPSQIFNFAIGLNIILFIVATIFILKSSNSLSAKLFAFLVSLFIPFLGSLFVLLNYCFGKGANSEKALPKS